MAVFLRQYWATGYSLNIVFFPLNVMIFPNSASFVAALICYLPSSSPSIKSGVHPLTPRENRERSGSEIYLKIFEKTQYLINTLYYYFSHVSVCSFSLKQNFFTLLLKMFWKMPLEVKKTLEKELRTELLQKVITICQS